VPAELTPLRNGLPKHCVLTVPMAPGLYQRLADMAAANRRSMSNLVRLLIEQAWEAEAA
jgi:hypothetical protein